jgi:hypothetical protein
MKVIHSVSQARCLLSIVIVVSLLGIAAPSFAGLNVSTYAGGPTWVNDAPPLIQTTAAPQTTATLNMFEEAGQSVTQTFKTGAEGFKLNMIDIYAGGFPGGTGMLNIYPDPVGGENTDGFVNTSFSDDLLGGGQGLPFTFNGNPGLHYLRLDLTGPDEITLAPNMQYAIEIDVLTGTFSWQRSVAIGMYADGNIYHAASEFGFNGTPPANLRGERDQVGGNPDRDGAMALYGPGPTTLIVSNTPDGTAWPGNPVHKTTGSMNLQTDWNTEVTLDPGGAATHTFTPDTTFKLDKFMIRAAGAPTTGELYLYQDPVGGTEADGFVNVEFGNSLLTALPFTFSGTTGTDRTLLEFDLLGSSEITLQAGIQYAIDLRNTGTGSMFWMRDENSYSGGNIYALNPAPGTERFDVVGGSERRDGALALYAAGTPGDFNNDGKVDAGDYATWRKNETANAALPNDNGAGNQAARFALWRANFGNPSGAAAGLAGGAVPEPSALLLAISAMGLFGLRRASI